MKVVKDLKFCMPIALGGVYKLKNSDTNDYFLLANKRKQEESWYMLINLKDGNVFEKVFYFEELKDILKDKFVFVDTSNVNLIIK